MAKKPPKDPEPQQDGTADKKKKGKSKKKLFIVAALVIVAVGAFGYMSMPKKKAPGAPGAPTTTLGGPIIDESSLTVNLRDGHYLEFTVGLQVNPGQSQAVLTKDQAIVLDILNTQAQGMTEAQLLKPGGPARLKADILQAMSTEWPGLIQAVYFEQFVMQ